MVVAPVRLGIVEDHLRYREALRATIDTIDDLFIAWIVGDAQAAVEQMTEDPVDVAIVDLSIPGEKGTALIRRLRTKWPDTAFVVVSGHTDAHNVRQSFDSGATAYVVKGKPSELRDGIEAARANERYLSPQLR